MTFDRQAELERRAQQQARTCVHFTGVSREKCDAGIAYVAVRGESVDGRGYRYPCFHNDVADRCASRRCPTLDEARRIVEEQDRNWQRTAAVIAAAHADADARGLGKGSGGSGEIDCPKCGTGRLRYAVSGLNGHMHAACSTRGCCAWME